VVVVDLWRGGHGKINLFDVSSTGQKPVPPLMLIMSIRLRREFKEARGRARSSAFTLEPENSDDQIRIARQLSKYFSLPVLSLDDASENHRVSMHLSFDSSQHIQITFTQIQRMVEISPRVTMSKLIWEVPP
jgi:hypothetical protein